MHPEHVLTLLSAYPEENPRRYVQTGVCSCGRVMLVRSAVDPPHARRNLRKMHAEHVVKETRQ